jgi:hypothetical protein
VVKEALICGIGVVLSECSSANLSKKDFITIIPNHEVNNLEFVEQEIIRNREISLSKRQEIRDYGLSLFSWSVILDRYMNIIMQKN